MSKSNIRKFAPWIILVAAIAAVSIYINDEVRLKAKNKVKQWFDN